MTVAGDRVTKDRPSTSMSYPDSRRRGQTALRSNFGRESLSALVPAMKTCFERRLVAIVSLLLPLVHHSQLKLSASSPSIAAKNGSSAEAMAHFGSWHAVLA